MTVPQEQIWNKTLEVGADPFRLTAVICGSSNGIQVYVGGGTLPHIGSIVLAEPSAEKEGEKSCSFSVISREGHKEEIVARRFAEAICLHCNCPAAVTAGIHIDHASQAEIQKLLALSEELLENILADLDDLHM